MLSQRHVTTRRRGVVLMVVLAMLTLFTIIGITFVYLSDSYALSFRTSREAENVQRPEIDPEAAISFVLSQLIYDVNDTGDTTAAGLSGGIYSSLRGHSLARNMYGWNHIPSPLPGSGTWQPNDSAYNGVGRLTYKGLPGFASTYPNDWLINYRYFSSTHLPTVTAADTRFLRDPERLGVRTAAGNQPVTSASRGPYICQAVPYTYPDTNNIFLAVLDTNPASPTFNSIVTPSFHRPWLLDFPLPPAAPTNPGSTFLQNPAHPHWRDDVGKYLTLRPRPMDNAKDASGNPLFPYPTDPNGDVKNFDGGPGGNDSIWIDINAPIMTAKDGTRYKMLVAPLILELDGRVNLNIHGNLRLNPNNQGIGTGHAGNMGFGPWEVNLSKVWSNAGSVWGNAAVSGVEWHNLFLGNPNTNGNVNTTTTRVLGKYGKGGTPLVPTATTVPGYTVHPRSFAPVDYNGVNDPTRPGAGQATALYTMPAGSSAFPTFPFAGYGQADPLTNIETSTTVNHPLAFNPLSPTINYTPAPSHQNRLIPLSDMAAMLRYGGTNSEFLSSDLLRLCPTSFIPAPLPANPTATQIQQYQQQLKLDTQLRHLITTFSCDLDRPGLIPYVWQRSSTPFVLNSATYPPSVVQALVSNPFSSNNLGPLQTNYTNLQTGKVGSSEFDPTSWRSKLSQVAKLNLNRTLSEFPAPTVPGATWPTSPTNVNNKVYSSVADALTDRVKFAQDIFNYLQLATGARDPYSDPALTQKNYSSTAQWNGFRYLAQLAVNIVDAIDDDDYPTPFQWTDPSATPTEWVFGIETPRLVINEVYAQLDNYQAGLNPFPVTGKTVATRYHANFWVELYNPFPAAFGGIPDNPNCNADLRAVLENNAGTAIYRLLIMDNSTGAVTTLMRQANNTKGTPTPPAPVSTLANFGFGRTVLQNSYLTLGPPANSYLAAEDPIINVNPANRHPQLSITIPIPAGDAYPLPAGTLKYTLVLQRLLNPSLPANNNPPATNPTNPNSVSATPYNPYITIDYVDGITLNDARSVATSTIPNSTFKKAAVGFASQGRQQVWGANTFAPTQTPPPANGVAHTFGALNQFNGKAITPQQWFFHPDRQLVSKAELLSVGYCKPHELTQLFFTGGKPQQHLVPWLGTPGQFPPDGMTRLHRFFELADVAPRMMGMAMGGRTPGRINLNTAADTSIYTGVADPQPGNSYTPPPTNPNGLAPQLITNYLPGLVIGGKTPAQANPTGQAIPIYFPFGSDQSAGGDAVTSSNVARGLWFKQFSPPNPPPTQVSALSLLMNASNVNVNAGNVYSGLFAGSTTPTNPYQQYELYNKLFNNLTTRSNVFAVWLTIGFFEVDGNSPPLLKGEIGASEGRAIRHRMFAIVDRTQLATFKFTSQDQIPTKQQKQPPAPQLPQLAPWTINITNPGALTIPTSGQTVSLQPGMTLVYEPGTANEETVVLGPGLQATFSKSHNPGVTVIGRGNPGPWTSTPGGSLSTYDVRNDTAVVPYYAIID